MSLESSKNFEVVPVTKNNWDLFVKLFGKKGAYGNCWCMYYRLTNSEFKAGKVDDGNKNSMKDIIWEGKTVGLLGLLDGEPVAWCAFSPREHFIRLEKSRVHKRIDKEEVWSIPCFFIDKNNRRKGLSTLLLKGVIDFAREQGIKIIEAYPIVPREESIPDSFAWYGLYKTFEQAGFKIVDRTSQNRPMVRYYL